MITVVGYGSIGARRAKILRALGEEVEVVDPYLAAAGRAVKDGFVLTAFPRVDAGTALVICTPPHHHLVWLRWAVERGLPCFVEKPLAASADGLAALIGAARAPIEVACNLRFHPGASTLRRAAAHQPVSARFVMHSDLRTWRPATDYRAGYAASQAQGGGVVLDSIHELDLAIHLFGPLASAAGAVRHSGLLELATEDVAAFVLRHRAGMLSTIHLSYLGAPPVREAQLFFAQGPPVAVDLTGIHTMYEDELRHFLAVARGAAAPTNPLAGAVHVLEVALAVRDRGRWP